MAETDDKVNEGTITKPVGGVTQLVSDWTSKRWNPLWLPDGSIRGIMVLMTLTSFLYMVCTKEYVPEKLWSMVMLMVGWYFLMRNPKTTNIEK